MKYKEYPKRKDSGVEWIGEIPEHWDVIRLKFLSNITTGEKNTEDRDDEGQYPFFVRSKIIERISTYFYDGEAILSPGEGDVGKIVHYINGKFDLHQRMYAIYDFVNISGKFCYWYLKTNLKNEVMKNSKKVTVESVRLPFFFNFPITFGSEEEQNQIADFLEEKTTQFDKLTSKMQKQITLLEEKREATITQAVTKGLDPSVKMKDSGVEWIGKIPEGWEVVRLKHNHAQVIAGQSPSSSSYVDDGRGIQFLQGCETFGDLHPHPKIRTIEPTKIVQQNTVLISVRAPVGTLNIANSEICIGRGLAGIVAKENNLSYKFLYYFLNLSSKIISGGSRGTTFQSIRTEELENSLIVSMPYEEQEQISEFLDKQTTQFDELIAKSKAQITLLEEKRQALITATVTGKIDVRS